MCCSKAWTVRTHLVTHIQIKLYFCVNSSKHVSGSFWRRQLGFIIMRHIERGLCRSSLLYLSDKANYSISSITKESHRSQPPSSDFAIITQSIQNSPFFILFPVITILLSLFSSTSVLLSLFSLITILSLFSLVTILLSLFS